MAKKATAAQISEFKAQHHYNAYPLATRLNMLITTAAANQSNAISRIHRNQGLKLTPLSLLYDIVAHDGSTTQKELSDHFPYTNQAMTQALNYLEKEELVVRTRDKTDRRVKHIVITDKGLSVTKDALLIRDSFYQRMTECITAEEAETLITLLKKLDDFFFLTVSRDVLFYAKKVCFLGQRTGHLL